MSRVLQTRTFLGRPFVVGLSWAVLDEKLRPSRALAQVLGTFPNEEKPNAYALIRTPGWSQAGLGIAKSRMKGESLAAALAMARPDAWTGLYQLEDGLWWLISVQEGMISAFSEVDQLFFDKAEAFEAFDSVRMATNGRTEIFEEPHTAVEAIEALLLEAGQAPRLEYISSIWAKVLPAVGVIVILAALAAGVSIYRTHQLQVELERQEAERLALEEQDRQRRAELAAKAQIPVDPWEVFLPVWDSEPSPGPMITRCVQGMQSLPIASQGWKAQKMECVAAGIRTTWQREAGGFIDRPGNAPMNQKTPNTTYSGKNFLEQLAPRPAGARLLNPAEAAALLYEMSFALDGRVNVEWKDPEAKKVEKPGRKPQEVIAPYTANPWNISLALAPLGVDGRLDRFPGCVVKGVEFDLVSNQWRIVGVLYALP